MTSKNHPAARQDNIVVQELKGELLIYDLKINKAYCLNETSTLVYQFCDGNNSVTEISGQMIKSRIAKKANKTFNIFHSSQFAKIKISVVIKSKF